MDHFVSALARRFLRMSSLSIPRSGFASDLRWFVRSPLGWLAAVLALLFVLSGLTGHDPWKQDEAYSFGMVLNLIEHGDWVVPRLADDPFMEKPPLYYWTAAFLAQSLDTGLPAHDAARLASGFYLLLTLLFTTLLARLLWGEAAGPMAVLVLIGCLVIVQHGHYLITDTALTAGMALGLLGLALCPQRWLIGGLALGTGAGMAFLAKGVLGPGMLGVSALALLAFPAWRSRDTGRALLAAWIAALPWLVVWPVALYLRDPALFQSWFWDNNIGRFLGGSDLGPPAERYFWLRTFPWATFPAAPLALWALWVRRRELFSHCPLQAVLMLTLVGWSVLFTAHTARDLYALPLIAPLAVIAAGGLTQLPRWFRWTGFWFSLLMLGLLACVLWLLWLFGALTGAAPDWPIIAGELPLVHDFRRPWPLLVAALAVTLGWALLLWRLRPPHPAGLVAWPAGVVLLWCLFAWLHLPWIDQAKSYRVVMLELKSALPAEFDCVSGLWEPETLRLRESERGLLHYFTGVKIQLATTPAEIGCEWLLLEVQRRKHPQGVTLGPDWELIWQGQREVDRRDMFMLFKRRAQRVTSPAPTSASAPTL